MLEIILIGYCLICYIIISVVLVYKESNFTLVDIILFIVSPLLLPVLIVIAIKFWSEDKYGNVSTARKPWEE